MAKVKTDLNEVLSIRTQECHGGPGNGPTLKDLNEVLSIRTQELPVTPRPYLRALLPQ